MIFLDSSIIAGMRLKVITSMSRNFLGKNENISTILEVELVSVKRKTNRLKEIILSAATIPIFILSVILADVLKITWNKMTKSPIIKRGKIRSFIFCFFIRSIEKINIKTSNIVVHKRSLRKIVVVVKIISDTSLSFVI